jgi:hypothetical protein
MASRLWESLAIDNAAGAAAMALPAQRADDTTVYVDYQWLGGEVELIGSYEPALPATWDDPGNAASFELHAVYDSHGQEVGDTLDSDEVQDLEALARQALARQVREYA